MGNRLEGGKYGRWKTSYQVKIAWIEGDRLQRHLVGIFRSDLSKINSQKHQDCILNQRCLTPLFHHRAQIKLSEALGTQMLSVGSWGNIGCLVIHYLACNMIQEALGWNGPKAPSPSVCP